MGFTFPRLHTGKDWYIDFKAYDPISGQMKRKKYFVPKQAKKSQMKAEAAVIIERLTQQLQKGWTLWANVKNIRATNKIEEMLDRYLSYIELGMREGSRRTYRSRVKVLREYMKSISNPPIYCYRLADG